MNATLTSTLRVYDEKDGAKPLVDTTDRAEIARILGSQGSFSSAGRRARRWTATSDRSRSLRRTATTSTASSRPTATRPST